VVLDGRHCELESEDQVQAEWFGRQLQEGQLHVTDIYNESTFEVFGCQQDRAHMVVLDQDSDLVGYGGPIKAHHKQLTELPVLYKSQ
jgi:hypothetical protein